MEASDWISLVLGAGGLAVGAWGMWLSHTAQGLGLQQVLHEQQMAAAMEFSGAAMKLALIANGVQQARLRGGAVEEGSQSRLKSEWEAHDALFRRYRLILPEYVLDPAVEFANRSLRVILPGDIPPDNDVWGAYEAFDDSLRGMIGAEPLSARTRKLLLPSPPR